MIFFGYTSCPDICPTTLARLAEVMKALGPAAGAVQVLFVTLDPERDSAERLKEFVPWFHPSFLGLRGDQAQIKVVTDEFRVFSARKEVGSELGYVLDHSSGAYVFDPVGRLAPLRQGHGQRQRHRRRYPPAAGRALIRRAVPPI